jgi:hypothetical protein
MLLRQVSSFQKTILKNNIKLLLEIHPEGISTGLYPYQQNKKL